MKTLKNTCGLLIACCATLSLNSMYSPSRLSQQQKRLTQLKTYKQQQQNRSYRPLTTSPLQPTVEIKKPTFLSRLSDWWYGTSSTQQTSLAQPAIPIGTTVKRQPTLMTRKELDGNTITVFNKIITLVAQDNSQENSKKIAVIIKRKLENETMYTDNFCQTLSLLIARQLPYDQEKYESIDEIMNIANASRIFKTLIPFIDRNKIPTSGFYLLKQLNAPVRKNWE